MRTLHIGRRAVLAGTAAAAASLPLGRGRARAAATPVKSGYRWRNVVQGGTGFITGVLFHPSVRGLASLRTDIGGAYRWDDRADRWIPLTDHLGWDDRNPLGVEAMAVDPAHPNRVYLSLGAYTRSWAGNGAVPCSDDRGAAWKRTDLGVKLGADEDGRGCGERLLVDPRDSDTLWLGTRHDGLLKSADQGATWQTVSLPAAPSTTGQGVTLLVAVGRSVYADWGDSDGTSANLYRTSDGATWEAVPGQPTGTAGKVPIRAAHDRHTREPYVAYANAPCSNGQSEGSVHKLRTTGGKWTEVTPVNAVRPSPGSAAATPHAPWASARPPGALPARRSTWSAPRTPSPPSTAPTTRRRPGHGSATTVTSGTGPEPPSPAMPASTGGAASPPTDAARSTGSPPDARQRIGVVLTVHGAHPWPPGGKPPSSAATADRPPSCPAIRTPSGSP